MAEEVIRAKDGMKGCLYVGCLSFLLFILSAAGYLIYIYYIDDSIAY